MVMGVEVFSCAGAQDMDTSRYQVFDLDDVELYSEKDQRDVNAVFRLHIDIPSHPSTTNIFEIVSMAENSIRIDGEQDMEISPLPHPTTPVPERQIQSHPLTTIRFFGTRIENVPDFFYRNLFE